MFACDECGFEAGCDHNAALNLARLAASSAVTACEARSGMSHKTRVKRASVKQEENTALLEAAQKCRFRISADISERCHRSCSPGSSHRPRDENTCGAGSVVAGVERGDAAADLFDDADAL